MINEKCTATPIREGVHHIPEAVTETVEILADTLRSMFPLSCKQTEIVLFSGMMYIVSSRDTSTTGINEKVISI